MRRVVEIPVSETTSSLQAGRLATRLARQLYLEDSQTSGEYALLDVETMRLYETTEVVMSGAVRLVRRPVVVTFYLDKLRENIHVDISSPVRDVLPILRKRFGPMEPVHFVVGNGELLNLSLSFRSQSICEGATVRLRPVATLLSRPLSSFEPSISETLSKRSNLRWQKRNVIIAERSVVYFKPDASIPSGVVPLDFYGLTLVDSHKFRLSHPNNELGVPLKPTYDFDGDVDGKFGAECLRAKQLPLMFGVPWHWSAELVLENLQMLIAFLDKSDAANLSAVFLGSSGSQADISWLVELFDTDSPAKQDVLAHVDVRTVLTLFKRWLFLLPVPFLPWELCTIIYQLIENEEAPVVPRKIAEMILQEKGKLREPFREICKLILRLLHSLWTNSSINGCTLTMLGRCFGAHLCALRNLSSCARVLSTLVKNAPEIISELDSQGGSLSDSPVKHVRWNLLPSIESGNASQCPSSGEGQFFHFSELEGEGTTTSDSIIEFDVVATSPRPGQNQASEPSSPRVGEEDAQQSLASRVDALEQQLREERHKRLLLEQKVEELINMRIGTTTTSTQLSTSSRNPFLLGHQRSKTSGSQSSDMVVSSTSTPQLPPKRK